MAGGPRPQGGPPRRTPPPRRPTPAPRPPDAPLPARGTRGRRGGAHDRGPRRVRCTHRRQRIREAKGGGDRQQLLLDRELGGLVLALAEVKPAKRSAPTPQE